MVGGRMADASCNVIIELHDSARPPLRAMNRWIATYNHNVDYSRALACCRSYPPAPEWDAGVQERVRRVRSLVDNHDFWWSTKPSIVGVSSPVHLTEGGLDVPKDRLNKRVIQALRAGKHRPHNLLGPEVEGVHASQCAHAMWPRGRHDYTLTIPDASM